VVLVERSDPVVSQLRSNVLLLATEGVRIVRADALTWLGTEPSPFHIVFLDPPFADGLLGPACDRLAQAGWLAPAARIYLETDARAGFPPLPDGWELVRDRTAGQVRFGLALAP
jgi:16S rRNA (guanine966-N2)-methyltransferase